MKKHNRTRILGILTALLMAFSLFVPIQGHAEDTPAASQTQNKGFDKDAPVIGDLSLSHNGQTVSDTDQLGVSLQAEDLGVGIKKVILYFVFEPEDENFKSEDDVRVYEWNDSGFNDRLSYDEKTHEFKGVVPLNQFVRSGTLSVYHVYVEDRNGNYTRMSDDQLVSSDKDGEHLNYSVKVEVPEPAESDIKLVSLEPGILNESTDEFKPVSDRTFNRSENNGSLVLKADFSGDLLSSLGEKTDEAVITFRNLLNSEKIREWDSQTYIRWIDGKSAYIYAQDNYGQENTAVPYDLSRFLIIDHDGNKTKISMDGVDTSYQIKFDENKSQIQTHEMSVQNLELKKGEVLITDDNAAEKENLLEAGDVLNISITADADLTKADISDANLYLTTNGKSSSTSGFRDVRLTYSKDLSDEKSSTFTGSLEINEDMYPTVWYASEIYVNADIDEKQNEYHGDVQRSANHLNNSFLVTKQGTSVVPQTDLYAGVYGYDENGYVTYNHVDLGQTNAYSALSYEQIKKLNLPENPQAPDQNSHFEGWYVQPGNVSSFRGKKLEDYHVTLDNSYITVYPVFSPTAVTVKGRYTDRNGFEQKIDEKLPEDIVSFKDAEEYYRQKLSDSLDPYSELYIHSSPLQVEIYTGTKEKVNTLYVYYEFTNEDGTVSRTNREIHFKGALTQEVYDSAFTADVNGEKNWKTKYAKGQTFDDLKGNYSEDQYGYANITVIPASEESLPISESQDIVYRVYNPSTGEHLFTNGKYEYDYLSENGWTGQGVVWYGADRYKNNTPVYRLYSAKSGKHRYTTDKSERDDLISDGWKDEGSNFFTSNEEGFVPVYELYLSRNDDSIYTTSQDEVKALTEAGWVNRGEVFKAQDAGYQFDAEKSPELTEPENPSPQVTPTPEPDPIPTVSPSTPEPTVTPELPVDDPDTPNINEKTSATEEEKAVAEADPERLEVVEATEGNDGGIKATEAVIQEQTAEIEEEVSEAAASGNKAEVTIDMNGANIVTKEVLEAARGNDVDLVFNMDGYSWTINGNDIGFIDVKDINLSVDTVTDSVPASTVEDLAGESETQQISLRHEGNFGFRGTLKMTAPLTEEGNYANLFWYDSSNKLVFQDSSAVASDGSIELDFAHASDYVIVYGKDMRPEEMAIYRLYNKYTGEHLYTEKEDEYESLGKIGWKQEGAVWYSPKEGGTKVYRLFNPYEDTHIYTTTTEEYNNLKSLGWDGEGYIFYSAETSNAQNVYRLYNPYSEHGLHLFTMDQSEAQNLIGLGWKDEGSQFKGELE
jgi:hypothetical protein